MMRKYFYPILLLSFVAFVSAIIVTQKKDKEKLTSPIKERRGQITMGSEWLNAKQAIEGLIASVDKNPNDTKAKMQLAMGYIQEARATGDHAYYDKAAMKLIKDVLAEVNNNSNPSHKDMRFEATMAKSIIQASQHHFTDALNTANEAVKLNPYNAYVYGIVCDANVELGNYAQAIDAADKMVSIRPDIKSYSRVAYLREIHGDYNGAKEAMQMAVNAGYPGMEQTEWCRTQLAQLYEKTGVLDSANALYNMSLNFKPDYAYAHAGLGRIAQYNQKYDQAIDYFTKANQAVVDYSFNQSICEIYMLQKNKTAADKFFDNALEQLQSGEHAANVEDDEMGHYADRELSNVYLLNGQYDKAIEHAIKEYNRRPANIDVNETLAWAYYKNAEYGKAMQYINVAMKTTSQNAVLLKKASAIYAKNNLIERSKQLSMMAEKINPAIQKQLLCNPGFNTSQLALKN
ncbi:MAG: transposase [Bacteroidetes bacterium]|nr:transposase [Bacteroidota bacterium]